MTVGIAAICNVGPDQTPVVVCASDRMITIGDLEYEPAQTKTVYFASQTAALLAGEMELHATVCPLVSRKIGAMPATGVTVREIADIYADEFSRYRRSSAERHLLTPLGLTLETFLEHRFEELKEDLQNWRMGSEAIVAGVDQYGAHIFKIVDPGIVLDLGTSCFGAIGIGGPHAESQFMIAKFDKKWSAAKTIFLTYTAKIQAENAAGVGRHTDLIAIRSGARLQADKDDLDLLQKLYEERKSKDEDAANKAYKVIQDTIDAAAASKTQPKDSTQTTASPDGKAG